MTRLGGRKVRFIMKRRETVNWLVITTVIIIVGTQASGEPALNINRFTIDGGGVMQAVGGMYELSSTIGQPDAGVSTGGDYQMSAAFWFPVPPGDANEDGIVNLVDYAEFYACSLGPDGGPTAVQCRVFDVNRSGNVDLADFAAIQVAYSGP